MKKFLLITLLYTTQTFAAPNLAASYQDFKNELQNKTGLSYSLDASFLPQRGAPNGKGTAWQSQYYGTVAWNAFNSKTIGNGTFNVAYTAVRYWGINGATLSNRLGVVSSVNDYTTNSNTFDELSYTHTLPGSMKSVSVTVGQFPIYNFDGTDYNSNQQINFLNYALSQNASEVYSTAGLGGFITWMPSNRWSISVGTQDARNVSGSKIKWEHGKAKLTAFGSVMWTPTWNDLDGEYSVLLYYQPRVPAQPESSIGWSFNAQQYVTEKMALFARANGVDRTLNGIKQSYSVGGVFNNPFNRNSLDQIGVAMAINKLNKAANGPDTRSWETILESYIAFAVSNFITLTPDIQFYIKPGLDKKHNTATVFSFRATLMF